MNYIAALLFCAAAYSDTHTLAERKLFVSRIINDCGLLFHDSILLSDIDTEQVDKPKGYVCYYKCCRNGVDNTLP